MNVNSSLKMMSLREAVMKRLVVFMCLAVAVLVVAPTGQVQAEIIQYTISVNVTDALDLHLENQENEEGYESWDFSGYDEPPTFIGTFDADDTVPGSISNFALTVGGLDIATSHPDLTANIFDPTSLSLDWGAFNSNYNAFVGFGKLTGFVEGAVVGDPPANYVVAIENNDHLPLDPFLDHTQNWVGTYSITGSGAGGEPIPEPGTLALLGLGAAAAGVAKRRRQKRAAA